MCGIEQGFDIVVQHLFVVQERVVHAPSHEIAPFGRDVWNLVDVVDQAYKKEV